GCARQRRRRRGGRNELQKAAAANFHGNPLIAVLWLAGSCLLGPDVGLAHDFGPLPRIVAKELLEVGGRAGERQSADLDDSRTQRRIVETGVDLLVEALNNVSRRFLRGAD